MLHNNLKVNRNFIVDKTPLGQTSTQTRLANSEYSFEHIRVNIHIILWDIMGMAAQTDGQEVEGVKCNCESNVNNNCLQGFHLLALIQYLQPMYEK